MRSNRIIYRGVKLSIVIDIFFIVIICLTVYSGISKGFVRTVMNFFTFVAALICGWQFSPILSEYYYENFFFKNITESAHEAITSIIGKGAVSLGLDTLFNEKPQALIDVAGRFNTEVDLLEERYYALLNNGVSDTVNAVAKFMAQSISEMLSDILAFLTIFLGVVILLKIVTLILDLIFKIPVLNFANRFFGALLGIFCGALYVWVFSIILTNLVPVLTAVFPESFTPAMIENSILLGWFNEYNLLTFIREFFTI